MTSVWDKEERNLRGKESPILLVLVWGKEMFSQQQGEGRMAWGGYSIHC